MKRINGLLILFCIGFVGCAQIAAYNTPVRKAPQNQSIVSDSLKADSTALAIRDSTKAHKITGAIIGGISIGAPVFLVLAGGAECQGSSCEQLIVGVSINAAILGAVSGWFIGRSIAGRKHKKNREKPDQEE